jgi:arylsulfatase A-like enzyme
MQKYILNYKIQKLIIFSFVLISVVFYQNASLVTGLDRSHVVIIYLDDLDVNSFNDAIRAQLLPNISSEILAKGYEFKNSYVTFSLCCPSRATYFTGLYPHNHGVLDVGGPNGGFATYRNKGNETRDLPTWLKKAGYTTGLIGKYMNGFQSTSLPPASWDFFAGFYNGKTYCMSNYGMVLRDFQKMSRLLNYNSTTFPGDVPYQTDTITDLALNFLNTAAAKGTPIYLSINPTTPHLEYDCSNLSNGSVRPPSRFVGRSKKAGLSLNLQKPSFNESNMSDKAILINQQFLSLSSAEILTLQNRYNDRIDALMSVDDLVGDVVAHLKILDLYDNTVIIFSSDNGYLLGEHRMKNKILPYEESIQVPLIIKTPSSTTYNSIDEIVLNNDLAPSIADIAGATDYAPPRDGRSFKPLLLGQDISVHRKQFLIEDPLDYTGDSRYPFAFHAVRHIDPASSVNRMWVRYFRTSDPTTFYGESYNLSVDPLQLNSDFIANLGTATQAQYQSYLRRLTTCKSNSATYTNCFDAEN